MPGLSPSTDRFPTIAVRFICGAVIGFGIWGYKNYGDILSMSANEEWKSMLFHLVLWSVGIGLVFAFTSAKDDSQWLDS